MQVCGSLLYGRESVFVYLCEREKKEYDL